MKKKLSTKIFLDSGAFGMYRRFFKKSEDGSAMSTLKNRGKDDFSYTETPEYKKYRRRYAAFIKEHERNLDAYANLDVIGNAELTYKNQKWFEKRGLNPWPTWHIHTDIKWLQRYIDEGYPHICLGAMVGVSKNIRRVVLDRVWSRYLTDKDGMPRLKVHGFGLTDFTLMQAYPWFSVDSKAWLDVSRFGGILYPEKSGGEYDWCALRKISVTIRKTDAPDHIFNAPLHLRNHILEYLKYIKAPYGKSKTRIVEEGYKLIKKKELWFQKGSIVEEILKEGICNSRTYRLHANNYAFMMFEKSLPEWPWPIQNIRSMKRKGLLL